MVAALFEIRGWAGLNKYLFTGRTALSLYSKLDRVQDLGCLAEMGWSVEDTIGKKGITKLKEIIDKAHSSELKLKDFEGLAVSLSIGSIKCVATAEGEEAIDKLKAANKDAFLY